MTPEKRREMAEQLLAQLFYYPDRYKGSLPIIESALSDAYQLGQVEALKEAATELPWADISKTPIPTDFRAIWHKAQDARDEEAATRIETAAWLRDRAARLEGEQK